MREKKDEIVSSATAMIEYARSDDLLADAKSIIDGAKRFSRQSVNVALVHRNWLLGKRIAEEELAGENRADYGKQVIRKLAQSLTAEYGKGFAAQNLYRFVRLCRAYLEIESTALT